MDWSNVTAEELVDALREVYTLLTAVNAVSTAGQSVMHRLLLLQVDWKAPRPIWEFVSKFSVPKNHNKWTSRLKCNVYYYRTNYLIILALALVVAFLRRPLSLVAATCSLLALLSFNDPFAVSLK
eukprot:GHUV01051164.1.p1 GENE.GHUV01051164.1~~GHUV01051164.1.p1  ORF type:complete len:125 (-),score=31.09 GHUV01051164.1:431-805(-)